MLVKNWSWKMYWTVEVVYRKQPLMTKLGGGSFKRRKLRREDETSSGSRGRK